MHLHLRANDVGRSERIRSACLGLFLLQSAIVASALAACTATPYRPSTSAIAPAPPPPDDGKPARGGSGGPAHAAALEELLEGHLVTRTDPQRRLRVALPDGAHWTSVRFLGIPKLVGFRYGKDQHAVAASFVISLANDDIPGACASALEKSVQPWLEAFEVVVSHGVPTAITWNRKIVDIDSVVATTETLSVHDQYVGAYATYPAWKGQCLVFGVAIPTRGELRRATLARDRFVKDVFPSLQVIGDNLPQGIQH